MTPTSQHVNGTEPRHVRVGILGAGFGGLGTAIRLKQRGEDDFLVFLHRHALPRPKVNVRVGPSEVDFLWRSRRLVVETDFHDYHRGSVAFEDDHLRDMQLRRLGYTVHRYTGDQLRAHSAEIAAELREILG